MTLKTLTYNLERHHVPDYAIVEGKSIVGPKGITTSLKFCWADTEVEGESTYEIVIDFKSAEDIKNGH